jgi:phosphatidylglycerol:prolipoprotein diacylglycerol transferase
VHPVAFRIGGLAVYWYGVLAAAALILGLWTASRRAPRDGLRAEVIADLGIWVMIGAFAGARFLYAVTFWREEFAGHPWYEIFALRSGGVFYGGLIGASLVTVVYAWIRRLPLWKIADAMAPSVALGHALGRIGCFMTGCCYGSPTALPWGVCFPPGHATHPQSVHPTQLYEAGLDGLLYALLAWRHRHKRYDGQVFVHYLIAYAVIRFGVEFFRGDYEMRYLGGWAKPGQLVSLPILAIGLAMAWGLRRNRPARP